MDLFERGTRENVHFDTPNGQLIINHLWNLPLQSKTKVNLDDIAKELYRQIKESETISFVSDKTPENDLLQLKFDIVRHIINVRLDEQKRNMENAINEEKRQQIKEIIKLKKEKELLDLPIEELEKMV